MAAEITARTEAPPLLPDHLVSLHEGSGVPLDVIRERGYFSATSRQTLRALGFSHAQANLHPALVLPVWGPDGRNSLYAMRPDVPRPDAQGRPRKYELPPMARVRLDCPPRSQPMLADPSVELWITEGVKKADALVSRGFCAVALLGVWNFKGQNDLGGVTLLGDFDYIAWNGREVRIAFDNDVMRKPTVRAALDRLTAHLERKGAVVRAVYLPVGDAKGVDDYLLSHTADELRALLEAPRPAPRATPPQVELLDAAPLALARPLALIDGHGYAATWLYTRRTITESQRKDGEIVRHDPPIEEVARELFVMRDDGMLFGPGGDAPLDQLGLDVRLPTIPRDGKLWRAAGVQAYRGDRRPNPADVFARIRAVYDHYIDFAQSLAPQPAMCDVSACFSLETWFAAAFTVLGYPWPNGERGSGKTQWGICWAGTSYLGEVLLASGTFAALRDLADYGAALLFDDAENLNDVRRTDPDKRALLLAGNRLGASIPLKEPGPDGRWQIRWVNAYCPRGFTAIGLPDPVLASRAIVLPLARTADPARGNADPADVARWPCDQQQLQDDCWATALALIGEAAGIWRELDSEVAIIGREFEPWRPLIAVARLFERHGVGGLEARVRSVMHAYQAERADLLGTDRTAAVVRALVSLATRGDGDVRDVEDVRDVKSKTLTLATRDVCAAIQEIAARDEDEAEWATSRRVGRILARLRLTKVRHHAKARAWELSPAGILGLAHAYGVLKGTSIPEPESSKPNVPNGSYVPNVPQECPTPLPEAVAAARDHSNTPSDGRMRASTGVESEVFGCSSPSEGEVAFPSLPADASTPATPDGEVRQWRG
jgi:hypothetical protein